MKNKTKNITLKVNAELYEKFRKYCKEKGLTISSVKNDILRKFEGVK